MHGSGTNELVISIPGLLTEALSGSVDNSRGVFQVVYYSDSIISCLYKTSGPDPTAWLIAFDLKSRRVVIAHELESTDKIFVRHNRHYLYYGTHSELGTDGYKKWVLHGCDLKARKWFGEKVHLPDMVGSEIGSTICFEFHAGFFYALSNQTSFEVEEIDWTSFYHCIRFPLNSPCKALVEKTENKDMWRRQHQEGPIDDRWTVLRLDEDECTGELKIVEARKEWYLGSSKSQRTYYTTKITFPKLAKNEDTEMPDLPAAAAPLNTSSEIPEIPSWASRNTIASQSAATVASSSSAAASSTSNTTPSRTALRRPDDPRDFSAFPDDPILGLINKDDNPHYLQAPPRKAEETHPGNDGSSQPTFTLAKSCIRTYHTSCNTFIDLVDDPLPTDWQSQQRLRLRAGSRRLGPPLLDAYGLLRQQAEDLSVALDEMYVPSPITYWPVAQDPLNPQADLDAVYRLLNPPSHLGNVHGVSDERSMIYVTGGHDKPQAIIFISFDPSIKLVGLKKWSSIKHWGGKGVGEGPHVDGRATGCCDPTDKGKQKVVDAPYVDVEERDRTVSIDKNGKGKRRHDDGPAVQHQSNFKQQKASSGGNIRVGGTNHRHFAWKEGAMYRDIALGFYFGSDQKTRA